MNLTQLQTLKALIAATPACAGQPIQTQANILNAQVLDAVTSGDIPRRVVMRILAARGIISKCYDRARDITLIAADPVNTHKIRSLCFGVEIMLNAGDGGLDMSDPANVQMIDALVVAGIAAPADRTALVNATKRTGSLAQAAGLPVVSAGDVDDSTRV